MHILTDFSLQSCWAADFKILKLKCNRRVGVTETEPVMFSKTVRLYCVYEEKKELTGRKCLFPWNNNRKIKPRLQGQFTPNFFPLNRPSVTQAARGGTLIVHSWGAFGLLAPRWMVKPTIGSFKLFFFLNHHSHVLIKTNKKNTASCLQMSRVEFDQFQRMCQESWKSLPRLTRVVRAATDYWTKLQPCVVFALLHSPFHSLPSPPLSLSLGHKILHYNTASQWV